MEPPNFDILASGAAPPPGFQAANQRPMATDPQFVHPPPEGHTAYAPTPPVPPLLNVSLQSTVAGFLNTDHQGVAPKPGSSRFGFHSNVEQHGNRRSPNLDTMLGSHSNHSFSQEDVNRIDEDFRQFLSSPSRDHTRGSRDVHDYTDGSDPRMEEHGIQDMRIHGIKSMTSGVVEDNRAKDMSIHGNSNHGDKTTDETGRRVRSDYDIHGDKTVDETGRRVRSDYDIHGDNTVDENGGRGRSDYDIHGNRNHGDKTMDETGRRVRSDYDIHGDKTVDENGGRGRSDYDIHGNRNHGDKTMDENGGRVRSDYDIHGDKTMDENGGRGRSDYDSAAVRSPDDDKERPHDSPSSPRNRSPSSFHDDAKPGPSNQNDDDDEMHSNNQDGRHDDENVDDTDSDVDDLDLEEDGRHSNKGEDSDFGSDDDPDDPDDVDDHDSDLSDLDTDDENLSEMENSKLQAEMRERDEKQQSKKERDVFKDFVVQNDDDDDAEESEEEMVYDTDDDVEENSLTSHLDQSALDHLTRLRARMSSRDGGRDDMNRYFEALISYDESQPSDKPLQNSDEEWTAPDPETKKRFKMKKNRKGSPKKAHKCHVCARIFYQAKQFEKHLATHVKPRQPLVAHASKLPPGVKLPPQRDLTCETCGKEFRRPAHLTRHRLIHTGEKPHICDVCGDRFSRPDKLRVHKKLHDKNRQFTCKVCGEKFALNKLLRIHKKTHRAESSKLYTCDVCNKNFTVYARLHRHRMIHSGRKPYLCEICGDRFTQSTDLQRHRIIHTGIKAHLCDLCGKKFYHSAHLRRHVKIHDRQKNYICGICGGQFARSDILKRHEKIHTGEKEFACEQCGKLFTRSSHLQRHMVTHNGRPPMQMCKFCSKPFVSSEKLKQHIKMHHSLDVQGEMSSCSQQQDPHVQLNRDCSVTPDASHPCTPVPVQSPCQRSAMIQTPEQSRMQSPSTRSHCSEPDRMQYRPFTGDQQFHFNHHLGLQPHQGFFSNGPRYDCMVCGEQFPNANMLEIHYSVHTLDKHAYIPNMGTDKHMEGQYMPPRPFDLHRHNEIYRCDNCGDRFNDLGHYQIHCLMHTSDFTDSYQRQLQFTAAPFGNPSFPMEKRPQKMDNFRPLLGPIPPQPPQPPQPQPQNLSINQVNPSCERSKQLYRQDSNANSSPQEFQFSLNPHQPQFPEPYRNQPQTESPPMNPSNKPNPNQPTTTVNDYIPRTSSVQDANVPNKPVSIMNNLKAKKRPRLLEALPESDLMHEAVGYTLDGRAVLNPDVNLSRTKQGDQRKFKCGTCGDFFDTPQERIEHVKIHIADMETQNSCEYCDAKFTNAQELRAHVKTEHKSLTDKENEQSSSRGSALDGLERVVYSPTPSVTSSEIPVSMVPTTSSSSVLDVNFECVECEAVFGTEIGLRRHSRVHSNPKQVTPKEYNCEVCFKSFLRPHHLTRHRLIHSGLKPHSCQHCSMAFARTDKLSSHLTKVHGLNYSPPKKEVKCEKCDIVFGTKADLRDHLKTTHVESFDCDVCFKSFKRMDHLKRHRRTHSKSPSKSRNSLNICEYCNHEFKSEYELNQHVRRVHNDQQTFQCGLCQAKFVNNDDLTLHQTLMHDADSAVDSVEIDGEALLAEELGNESGDNDKSSPRVRRQLIEVECEVCQQKFTSHGALTRHKRTDHKELANQKCSCDLCGKEFPTMKQMRRHMKTHSNEKPYMCDECGDSFSRSSHLVRHKIRHTGEREFKCDQCPAQFSRSDHLLCHKRTHSGNKPYVCDICGLQFASGQGLKGHMTSHTGEKPYMCRHCGEQFARNSHLVRHRAQAHNDGVTHECELCGKSFARRDQLKRHEKTHSGEKPHVCQTCGKAFTRAPLLLKHEKIHEKQNEPMTHSRIPISMMDWPKWADYHPPPMATGHPQFPFSGSILQAAMSASHIS